MAYEGDGFVEATAGEMADEGDGLNEWTVDKASSSLATSAAFSAQAASNKVNTAPEVKASPASLPMDSSVDVSTPAATKNEKVNETRHDDMVMNIQHKVLMERQMQRLAMAHFAFWHFWFLFMPGAALTMASGVLAFLSTSEAIEEGHRTRLVVVVGCLALVATFVQTLNDLLKYGTRAEMHQSAVLDLKAIYDALDFMQISRIGGTKRHADVTEYQKIYSQVQQGCKSTIPLRVIQCFNTMDTRILSQIPANKEVHFEGKVGVIHLYETVSNEIYCAIAAYWLFPLVLPDPDRIMVLVLKRVHEMMAKDLQPAERSLNIGQLMLLREEIPHPRGVQRLAKEPEPRTASASSSA
jgi:hypothetical protein